MVHVLWQYVDWHITRTMTIDLYMYYVYFYILLSIYFGCCSTSNLSIFMLFFLCTETWFWVQSEMRHSFSGSNILISRLMPRLFFLPFFFFSFWCVTSALRLQLEQYKSIKVKLTSGNWYLSLRDRFRCEALGSLSGWLKYLMNI